MRDEEKVPKRGGLAGKIMRFEMTDIEIRRSDGRMGNYKICRKMPSNMAPILHKKDRFPFLETICSSPLSQLNAKKMVDDCANRIQTHLPRTPSVRKPNIGRDLQL